VTSGPAWATRFGAAMVASYVSLLVVEVRLWRKQPKSVLKLMERGLYVVDEEGVRLRPGARVHFDDGYARGDVSVSSLGYRGHEPCGDADNRVLILGDSFAFGSLLDQPETIDACMERLRPGREVINLGVTGYNLPEPLEPLRRWTLGARHVVYLFGNTDLDGTVEQLVVDGYRVRRLRHPDGSPFTDEEMGPAATRRIAEIKQSRQLSWRSLRLPRVRTALRRSGRTAVDVPTDAFVDPRQRAEAVARGIGATEEMRALAERRGMTFRVAIVPTLAEVTARSYCPAVADYVAALKGRGEPPLELIDCLSADLYWGHEGHFNPAGARVVARAIDAALSTRP